MRKMRKALSLVLVLALVLGSFSMVFGADDSVVLTDIAGTAGEDQILVAQNLGIVTGTPEGTFQPEKAVNRAEFAAIITRALAIPESALAGYSGTVFKDTDGYGWANGYLGYCQAKGIMLGDGYGNAMPGRTITVNEAVTMVARALGYVDSAAELVGRWPANYVTLGQALGLYENLSSDVTINKENAAILIYNALTVQLVAINSLGNTDLRWDPKDKDIALTLLNSGLGCTPVEEEVLGDTYNYDNSLINITNKLGAYGTAYVNKDKELVAFKAESTLMTGYMDGDKFVSGDKKYSFSQSVVDIHDSINGHFFRNTDIDDSNITDSAAKAGAYFAQFTAPGGNMATDGEDMTLSVDVSGSNLKEVYAVVGWAADDTAMIDADDVEGITEDQDLLGYDFPLNDNDEIDMKAFGLVGVASLDDIAADNVVYVYANSDEDIRKVAVGQEVVEGIIDEINGSDDFTIAGTDYEYASAYLVAGDGSGVLASSDVDSDAVVALDAFGFAYDIDLTGGQTKTFAVVQGATVQDSMNNAKAKLYTSEDATKTYTFADYDDVTVRGASGAVNTVALFNSNVIGAISGAAAANPLIGYKLDSDGYIDSIDLGITDNDLEVNSKTLVSIGGHSYPMVTDVVVMTYEGNGTDLRVNNDVSAIDKVDFSKSKASTNGAIVLNKEGTKAVAILIPADWAEKAGDDVFAVINKVSAVKDAQKVVGFADGVALTVNTTKTTTVTTPLDEAALYLLEKDAEGKVKQATSLLNNATYAADNTGNNAAALVVSTGGVSTSTWVIYTTDGAIIPVQSDVVVYKYDTTDKEYTIDKFRNIDASDEVYVFDTKGEKGDGDWNGIGTVVIYVAK